MGLGIARAREQLGLRKQTGGSRGPADYVIIMAAVAMLISGDI